MLNIIAANIAVVQRVKRAAAAAENTAVEVIPKIKNTATVEAVAVKLMEKSKNLPEIKDIPQKMKHQMGFVKENLVMVIIISFFPKCFKWKHVFVFYI